MSESKKNKQRAFYSWLTWYCFIKGVKPFTKFDWINHQLQGEGAMMSVLVLEAMKKRKSSLNDNTQPSQSDVTLGAVPSNAEGAATVISQRTKDDDANIVTNTNIVKSFIRKFKNMFEEDKHIYR